MGLFRRSGRSGRSARSARRIARRQARAMSRGFRRTPRGVEAVFDVVQSGVLRRLASDVDELLQQPRGSQDDDNAASAASPKDEDPLEALFADISSGPTAPPDDPVLARLLPDAYDDAGAAADFRRFTENELRSGKSANARLVRETLPAEGGEVLLDDEQAAAWLGALNDIRLSLGTALEVGPDTEREYLRLDPTSSRARRLYLYFWLGVLQETLLEAMTDEG